VSTQLDGISAALQRLLREHDQVRVAVATLGNEAETATRASIRASAQASAVAPMRDDVRALRAELDAQRAAIRALTKSVEALRSPAPAKRATKATKATKKS
jgi:LmbE family N-acetylglucosaminyl deacetylase